MANRIGIDGKVYDTTFVSNRASRIAEEISRDMGLTIAKEVRKNKEHKKEHEDPQRLKAKEYIQRVAYSELARGHKSPDTFFTSLNHAGIGCEPAVNKKGDVYGLRFNYDGQTFKASDIGKEFGMRTLIAGFGYELKTHNLSQPPGRERDKDQHREYRQSHSGGSGLGSLFSLSPSHGSNDDQQYYNELEKKRKKKKKNSYGHSH